MEYHEGICLLSNIAVRKEPTSTSEMVNQLLFGELYLITDAVQGWTRIFCNYDGYEGWISAAQVNYLTEEYLWARNEYMVQQNLLDKFLLKDLPINILIGSSIPGMPPEKATEGAQIIDAAIKYINAPYLWGGRSPFGIDCSGFTQVVYKMNGIKLLRDAYQQATQGRVVEFLGMSQAGDLAFFDNEEGRITHVGIIIEPGKIIHAHGKVRIDPIDQQGIYNTDIRKYSHNLRIMKRILHFE
jgi:hypothetical protein